MRKFSWRKRVGVGVAHAVRESDTKTVCGVTVREDWTAPGDSLREGTKRCRRCQNLL